MGSFDLQQWTRIGARMVLTLALTFYPLPQERKSPWHVFIFSADYRPIQSRVFQRDGERFSLSAVKRGRGPG
jgi:hypothetical protein